MKGDLLYRCEYCGAIERERDLEANEVGGSYPCKNCHEGEMELIPEATNIGDKRYRVHQGKVERLDVLGFVDQYMVKEVQVKYRTASGREMYPCDLHIFEATTYATPLEAIATDIVRQRKRIADIEADINHLRKLKEEYEEYEESSR